MSGTALRNAYLRDLLPGLRCPICIREYNSAHRPFVLLPCGHSVCETTRGRLERCPICRANIDNTVVNRDLLSVLEIVKKSQTSPASNQFLTTLRENKAVLEGIHTRRENWTARQVTAVNALVTAMKLHADDVDDDWVDAAGVHVHVAAVLSKKLTTLNHILRHRARIGWRTDERLPLVL
jgi:hypothetical protein